VTMKRIMAQRQTAQSGLTIHNLDLLSLWYAGLQGVPVSWDKTRHPQYKQRLFPTEYFHASFSWNYATVGASNKKILPPILGHTWRRMLPTAWHDYTGNLFFFNLLMCRWVKTKERLKDSWSTLEQFFMALYGNTRNETDSFIFWDSYILLTTNEPGNTDENNDRLWKMRTIFHKLDDAYAKYLQPN
jgi:hypothetical protein